jgi:hypothetical protein
VDTYRASGPGGQKRNKTSSAVRIRHPPSGLLVIAEESRSQHENRARALRRLRQALYLRVRDEIPAEALSPEAVQIRDGYRDARGPDGRLRLAKTRASAGGRRGPGCAAGVPARLSDAAAALGVSTGNLVDFLETDPRVWDQANQLRAVRPEAAPRTVESPMSQPNGFSWIEKPLLAALARPTSAEDLVWLRSQGWTWCCR